MKLMIFLLLILMKQLLSQTQCQFRAINLLIEYLSAEHLCGCHYPPHSIQGELNDLTMLKANCKSLLGNNGVCQMLIITDAKYFLRLNQL